MSGCSVSIGPKSSPPLNICKTSGGKILAANSPTFNPTYGVNGEGFMTGVSREHGWANLAHSEDMRPVPRNNRSTHADGRVANDSASIIGVFNYFGFETECGEAAQHSNFHAHLDGGSCSRLSRLFDEPSLEDGRIGFNGIGKLEDVASAVVVCALRPWFECLAGVLDGLVDILLSGYGDLGQVLSCGRVNAMTGLFCGLQFIVDDVGEALWQCRCQLERAQ